MPAHNRLSSFAWFMVHVTFPLVPFLLEGIIRIIVFGDIGWTTFRSSTLAMSVGILCLFVNQSLMGYKRIIRSKDETGNTVGLIHTFSWLAIFCFAFFGMVVFSSALMEELNSDRIAQIKHILDKVILIGAILPVSLSLVAQRTFRLRAAL
uniref:Uncharacterized protein n=1 Tax=Candidatus Kentrum eta TaxID=2126337 RepID=A0A450UF10_9GAMM|nr:MAG: hypothetical protein BECKH772A_GA0070896_100143 [Candidatus Kentron sp. H]VFJ91088.1 MAG: hypothetical protein BECKH772B_GA0070898_100143 [Candidatus Kentron sp. H]VFJ97396.1 MAG: hypothetical protein BECKH772C_GA0070978_100133 [Candidatus Kentron sp. H]